VKYRVNRTTKERKRVSSASARRDKRCGKNVFFFHGSVQWSDTTRRDCRFLFLCWREFKKVKETGSRKS